MLQCCLMAGSNSQLLKITFIKPLSVLKISGCDLKITKSPI